MARLINFIEQPYKENVVNDEYYNEIVEELYSAILLKPNFNTLYPLVNEICPSTNATEAMVYCTKNLEYYWLVLETARYSIDEYTNTNGERLNMATVFQTYIEAISIEVRNCQYDIDGQESKPYTINIKFEQKFLEQFSRYKLCSNIIKVYDKENKKIIDVNVGDILKISAQQLAILLLNEIAYVENLSSTIATRKEFFKKGNLFFTAKNREGMNIAKFTLHALAEDVNDIYNAIFIKNEENDASNAYLPISIRWIEKMIENNNPNVECKYI